VAQPVKVACLARERSGSPGRFDSVRAEAPYCLTPPRARGFSILNKRCGRSVLTDSNVPAGSQSLRRPSPRSFFVLTTSSSSRLPHPRGFFGLTASSSSRLLRPRGCLVLMASPSSWLPHPHGFFVLMAFSFSRAPRQIKGRHRLQPSRITKDFPI
jgi:hypothetical protein